jgi:capsid portal protein
VRDLQISGNVFILNILNVSGQIIGYQVLDPRTMRVVANKYGEVI